MSDFEFTNSLARNSKVITSLVLSVVSEMKN